MSSGTRVLYARGADLADGFPLLDLVPSQVLSTGDGRPGLDVAYYTGRAMERPPVASGVDSVLDVTWHDAAPRTGLTPHDYGVRWTATLRPPLSGAYRLALSGTLHFRLFLDDSVVVRSGDQTPYDEVGAPRPVESEPLRLEAGRRYRLRVDARASDGDAELQLLWSPPPEALEAEALRAAQDADAVVLCLGLTARLEGEEMRVELEGFRGGDRTRIDLPTAQERLLERVVAVGKPTVLVLFSGSALAVNWAQAHVPAIVEAWYPGQAGGNALADVLFGNYNPSGRLPVTFYQSVDDLPRFDDYHLTGRTYRFFRGTPLYPFGYGLSYTTFAYSNLETTAPTLSDDGAITVRVDVTNQGRRKGDEVVQLYVRHLGSSVERPREDLRGFKRVTLGPGEARTLEFPLPASGLAYWNADAHRWVVEAEPVELDVGASSVDIRVRRTITVVGRR